MAPKRLLYPLLLCCLALQCGSLSEVEPRPAVRLRTGTIQTIHAAWPRSGAAGLRRSVRERAHHTRSERWGALRDASQFLVTHRPSLGHSERLELVGRLRAAGLAVTGYIPEASLLAVGPDSAAEAAAALPGVLWVGPLDPEHKRAPEWEAVLSQLPALPSASALLGNGTAAASAAFKRLPCRVEWGSDGLPRLGIQVSMPRRDEGAEAGADGSSDGMGGGLLRAGRALRMQQQLARVQNAGEAAAEDWAAPLGALCSGGDVGVRPAGRSAAVVLSPPACLEAVLDWLAQRPAVHWLEPAPTLRLANYEASAITQSGRAPSNWAPVANADGGLHPVWAAGITGAGQIIGCGDSGVDRRHCFFSDPNVNDAAWASKVRYQDRVKTFVCPDCRKIVYYRAFGDEYDSNGHGTHVTGTLLGFPYSATSISQAGDADLKFIGMAPAAKLAFIDLGDGTSDSIYTPGDLERGYFDYTNAVGARIHSDSWGSSSLNYDALAAQVDDYAWRHKDFLPVFAAGNDGDAKSGSDQGSTTVTSPATAKNILCVGSTQTAGESTSGSEYTVYNAAAREGDTLEWSFRVLQAGFGVSIGTLGSGRYPLLAAQPLAGCAPLQNSVRGAVVLMQRGGCNFVQKAAYAEQAGAKAALIFDNVMGSYFVLGNDRSISITIPTMSITRRLGQQLVDALSIGRNVTMAFSPYSPPPTANSFENLASYSSQGPTKDNRIKPDIVAPGTLYSAKRLTSVASDQCGVMGMAGTSMSTPVVAGSATLVRQYFTDGYYPSGKTSDADKRTPSAALIKAVMISGAVSLQGVEADTGLPIDPPPSFRQGFGRVHLANSLQLEGGATRLQVVDESTGVNTGDAHQYCIRANGGALKITLVWTDYPGSPAAARALVNDLDLTVRAESYNGRPLFGNGGSVTDSSSPDRENNVEQVVLEDLPDGRVSIEVRGHSVYAAGGAQPYALVVTGAFNGTLTRTGAGGSGECAIVVAVITSGPSGVTNQQARFAFGAQSGNSAGVSFECQLADPSGNVGAPGTHDWKTCTSPQAYPGLADGNYQFSVRAMGEKIASSQAFKLDTTPPVMAFAGTPGSNVPAPALALPAGSSAEATAVLTWGASDASTVTFACKLTGTGTSSLQRQVFFGAVNSAPLTLGASYNCTSPQTFHWLLPGQWGFEVVGTDAAGNAAAPLSLAWAVAFDSAKQYTRLYSGLFGLVPGIPATFEFAVLKLTGGSLAAVGGAATLCWLESNSSSTPDWQACTSPKSYGTLPDGAYKFHARAASDPSAADTDGVSTFTVDSTPPITTITETPAALHTSDNAQFKFGVNEDGSTFECRLVNENDVGAGSPDFRPCSSPQAYSNLTDGQYAFSVRATDLVGNQGQPANYSFVIDTTPPRWTRIDYPVATNQPSFSVVFEANDGIRGAVQNITCRFRALQLVSGTPDPSVSQWDACTSPLVKSNLAEGHYGLTLRATDQAGLVNQTQELDIWVDFTPPRAKFSSGPPKNTAVGSTVTFNLDEDTTLAAGTGANISVYRTLLQSVTADQYKGVLNGTVVSLTQPSSGGASGGAKLQSVQGSSGVGQRLAAVAVATSADGTRATLVDGVQQVALADTGGSGGSTLNFSMVGTWANATSPLTYTGLANGYYALVVQPIDLAGNIGNITAPYPFQVQQSGGGVSSTVWIIVGAAGGALALLVAIFLFIWCRKRRRPQPSAAQPPRPVPVPVPTNGYPAGAYTNGTYSNGYSGAAGAWGYSGYPAAAPPPPGPAPAVDPVYQQQLALDAARRTQADAIYEQQLAYALAASQAETAGQHSPAAPRRPAPPPPPPAAEDDELNRAIQASLQEQRTPTASAPAAAAVATEEQDPEMRAAIEASLREQQRYTTLSPWHSSSPQGGAGGSGQQWNLL